MVCLAVSLITVCISPSLNYFYTFGGEEWGITFWRTNNRTLCSSTAPLIPPESLAVGESDLTTTGKLLLSFGSAWRRCLCSLPGFLTSWFILGLIIYFTFVLHVPYCINSKAPFIFSNWGECEGAHLFYFPCKYVPGSPFWQKAVPRNLSHWLRNPRPTCGRLGLWDGLK